MMLPTRPDTDTVHAIGEVQVIHPSDGKALTLVGEGGGLLMFCHVRIVCVRECVWTSKRILFWGERSLVPQTRFEQQPVKEV